ncbi:MAG: YcxB family protein [Pirellulales bacterium]|nr:YcxB family protein [Pirellulales bacterium]
MTIEFNPYRAPDTLLPESPTSAADVHSVEFDRLPEHIVDLNYYFFRNSPTWRGQISYARNTLLLTAALIIGLGVYFRVNWAIAIGVFVGFCAFLVPLLTRRNMRRQIKGLLNESKGAGRANHRRVTVALDGVVEQTQLAELKVRWPGVDRIDADPNYVYFVYTSVSATIIPRHAFHDTAHVSAFLDAARRWHAAALGGSPFAPAS